MNILRLFKIFFLFFICCCYFSRSIAFNQSKTNLQKYYNQKYYNYSKKIGSEIGILVIAYNRPQYFKWAIASLATNPEADYLPFIFILDGGPHATQEENRKMIEASTIKHKEIISRNSNFGCGRSIIDARRFMFDWCRFKKIIVFEEDLVISPHYISLVLNLHDWAQKKYDNVGLVQAVNRCFLSREEKKQHLAKVHEAFNDCWGYCMDKKTYNKVKRLIYEYEKTFLVQFLSDRLNGPAIAEWMRQLIKKRKRCSHKRIFKSTIDYKNYFERWMKHLKKISYRRDGQDVETKLILYVSGLLRITTKVNRAQYIGETGVHHTEKSWERKGFDQIVLDNFSDDACRTHFEATRSSG